eukprot:10472122-Karenia_brevis.AAC.1
MVVQGLLPQLKGVMSKDKVEDKEFKSKAILDEKYFRRMDKFTGDMGAYRMWMFNFTVAIGQVDGKLSDEIRKLINRSDLGKLPESWDPSGDPGIHSDTYTKFKTELYGVL